jgi:exodeoxyribonuclease V alpha subunit
MSVPSDRARESGWLKFPRSAADTAGRRAAFTQFAEALNLTRDAVQIAVEIASFEKTVSDDERDALIVLAIVALAALDDGSTRFPVTGAAGRAALESMLRPLGETALGVEAPARHATAIARILEERRAVETVALDESEYKPLLYLEPFIYMRKLRVAERELAARIAAMLAGAPAPSFSADECACAAAEVCAMPIATLSGSVILSGEQRAAVAASARSRFALISGGPGTGKTSIVIAILRLMTQLGVDPRTIALAAPTGKAANRIGECIARALPAAAEGDPIDSALRGAALEPSTLHRLLGYSPGSHRFRHHRNNPLEARVVIVDEGSMLDLALMERLAGAIGDGARLIVLGDADQLPSVAAGAVFRELIAQSSESGASAIDRACFRLQTNFRMSPANAGGAAILSVANRINAGETGILMSAAGDATRAIRRSAADELTLSGVEFLGAGRPDANEFFARWYDERIRGDDEIARLKANTYVEDAEGFGADEVASLRRVFAFASASRILTVTRVFETGAERINDRMHRRASGALFGRSDRFVAGEPVIAIRNDYERMLFNGDNGVVMRVRRREGGAPALMAVFPRRDNFVAFRIDMMREGLELAYAMTVHKAQGSEFDTIALILPGTKIPLLTRGILYTAVSRARRSVVIIGSENVLADGIAAPAARYSGLRELLGE